MLGSSSSAIRFPGLVQRRLERVALEHLRAGSGERAVFDFLEPAGEPALLEADSVSWRVFKNPVALLVGGIAAVILEFAEPRVRTGVWEHTTFRTDPLGRMRRTGLAAMITVYGARSGAERMIEGVRRMHERIEGKTREGIPYRANDPELLRWVHATASFGFLEAYCAYVRPLGAGERDRFYGEGPPVARLYGAEGAPTSEREMGELLAEMRPRLERSEIVFDFLRIMRRVPLLPRGFRPLNGVFVRAAVEIVPGPVREVLGLGTRGRLARWERFFLRRAGRLADRIFVESGPAVQSCVRLGLPPEYLYRRSE